MKLSNKILLGFFGLIFLYLTAAFVEIRLSGAPNVVNDKNSIAETVDIPGIAYLIINNLDRDIKVIGSDRPRLEVRSLSGDILKELKYRVSGDTLTLSGLQSEDTRTIRISLFVPETGLKGIAVNSSVATLEGLKQELLYISQNSGQIFIADNGIGHVHLEVSGRGHLNITATPLDTLSAKIDNSEVLISSPVGVLNGSMENNAFLRMSRVDEIQLKKDESSSLNVHQ
jgi:hypothetical protein